MSRCNFCKNDTEDVDGCDGTMAYMMGERAYPRVPFGKESGHLKILADYSKKNSNSCTHCNVSIGNHHHAKCDVEECPKCHQQMLLCGGHEAKVVRLSEVASARKR